MATGAIQNVLLLAFLCSGTFGFAVDPAAPDSKVLDYFAVLGLNKHDPYLSDRDVENAYWRLVDQFRPSLDTRINIVPDEVEENKRRNAALLENAFDALMTASGRERHRQELEGEWKARYEATVQKDLTEMRTKIREKGFSSEYYFDLMKARWQSEIAKLEKDGWSGHDLEVLKHDYGQSWTLDDFERRFMLPHISSLDLLRKYGDALPNSLFQRAIPSVQATYKKAIENSGLDNFLFYYHSQKPDFFALVKKGLESIPESEKTSDSLAAERYLLNPARQKAYIRTILRVGADSRSYLDVVLYDDYVRGLIKRLNAAKTVDSVALVGRFLKESPTDYRFSKHWNFLSPEWASFLHGQTVRRLKEFAVKTSTPEDTLKFFTSIKGAVSVSEMMDIVSQLPLYPKIEKKIRSLYYFPNDVTLGHDLLNPEQAALYLKGRNLTAHERAVSVPYSDSPEPMLRALNTEWEAIEKKERDLKAKEAEFQEKVASKKRWHSWTCFGVACGIGAAASVLTGKEGGVVVPSLVTLAGTFILKNTFSPTEDDRPRVELDPDDTRDRKLLNNEKENLLRAHPELCSEKFGTLVRVP